MQNEIEIGTGALQSPVDPRDWTLAAAGASQQFPESCFLVTDWMVPTMQGKKGCCVGCTGEEVVRSIYAQITGKTYDPGTEDELSFRFVYAVAKCLEGTPGYEQFRKVGPNDGTYGALVAKVIRKYGVPLAKFCPNDVNLDVDAFIYGGNIKNIPAEAFADAATRKSGADMVPTYGNTLQGIKEALNYAKLNKGAVMVMRLIGATYWQDAQGNWSWDKSKILPIRATPKIVSGHCEFLTGYDVDPSNNRMRIYWLNHWSKDWADYGRGWEYADEWLPYLTELRVVVPNVPVVDNFKYHFTKQLAIGDVGPDVVALQHILKIEACFPENQAFTGKYGPVTASGVTQLQQKYASEILTPAGLTHGTGRVGVKTLAWLQSHYGN